MIVETDCATCGKRFRKRYAAKRSVPRFCSRPCCDKNKEHQRRKSLSTAATRFTEPRTTEIVCKGCGKTVVVKNWARKRTWCSTRCKYSHPNNPVVEFNCKVCGVQCKSSERPGRASPRYCSRSCMGKDADRNAAISDAVKAVWKDPAVAERFRAKFKELCTTQEWKAMRREIMLAAYARGSFSEKSLTKPVRTVIGWLAEFGIQFEREVVIDYYAFDFRVADADILIEVNGDYWHGNPEVYAAGELTAKQRDRKGRDKAKAAVARRCGYSLIVLWEKDIEKRSAQTRVELGETLSRLFKSKV